MRILAAGDLHGDMDVAKKLAVKAAKGRADLVIISGDLTMAESHAIGLVGPFKERGQKVILIPGNHESIATADSLAQIYGATNLHGRAIKIGKVGVFGCGSANIGLFQLDEQEIYDLLKKGFKQIKNQQKKIMVTHVHPNGTLMERLTQFFPGSTAVRTAIERFKPNVAICSHVHEAEGIEEQIGNTRVLNVGKRGKIIEI